MLNTKSSEEMELRSYEVGKGGGGWSKRVGMGTNSGEERGKDNVL